MIRAILFAVLLAGCSSLPMDGSVLDAVRAPAEVEPTSCQCNVYCN